MNEDLFKPLLDNYNDTSLSSDPNLLADLQVCCHKSHEEVHSQQISQLQKVCPLAHSRGEEGHEKVGQSSQGSQAAWHVRAVEGF